MSRHNQRVTGVLLLRGVDFVLQHRRDGLVIVPETLMHFAAAAEWAGDEHGVDIGDPVAKRAAAAEGEHDVLICVVGGEEAGCVAVGVDAGFLLVFLFWTGEGGWEGWILVEFVEHCRAGSFHIWTIAVGAGDVCVGTRAVGVAGAVCCGGPLSVQV